MKRWLALLSILLAATMVAGIFGYRLQAPNRQRASFARIEQGMNYDEVIALMGYPEPFGRRFKLSPDLSEFVWEDLGERDKYYWVLMDENERVKRKGRDQ
jgi:hypothetical protein